MSLFHLLKYPLVLWLGLCAGMACSGSRMPSREELIKACPAAARVATVDCPAIAIAHCDGFDSLAECPNAEIVTDECDRRIDAELARCPS